MKISNYGNGYSGKNEVIIKAQASLSYLYAPINQEVFDDVVEELEESDKDFTVESIIEEYEDYL
jgi:hypothetical protein